MMTTSANQFADHSIDVEAAFQCLFGATGFQLVPSGRATHVIVESGMSLMHFRARCRVAIAAAPPGSGLIVLLRTEQTGFLRVARWVVLPLQVAIAARALARDPATLLGRFAVFPDLIVRSVTYELRSPAQRYAERFLVPHAPESLPSRLIRSALAAWAGCDPSVGAVLIVGKKA